jgi:tetratricopeptide (TPR) repeat protein/tRNA A-37 threonylcarbamoyl transferase component Bud32
MPAPSGLLDELERAATAEVDTLRIDAKWPRIGRYQACGKLGEGGMSTVWEAHDAELGRRVAIKLLHPELMREHGIRLRREARALATLSHPNVVHVYEAIRVEGLTALVMELVEGITLRQWQEREPRPAWRECIEVYVRAGRGLAAVHAAGLVHRDFKPANCIVDARGRVRVLDFGLVVRASYDETIEDVASRSQDDALELRVTRTGTVLGTPAYMPPERLAGLTSVDVVGDQFSFCVSLYEAIHGERPFAGTTEGELAEPIQRWQVRPVPRGIRVPARVRRILLRGLAADPERRWPSMEALLAELESAAGSRPRRWRWLAAVGASTAAALATAEAMRVGEALPCTEAETELYGVWDDERRQAVEAAILGAGTEHATDTWARIEPSLDDYARGWVAKHTDVCEATRVSGAQTEEHMGMRMRCLSGRRAALQEVVGVLRHADEGSRANAVELVAGLPALAQCDDLAALEAELPLPEDSEQAAAVEAARERLARARVRRAAGAHAAGEADASAVVEEAERLGFGPLLAEALLERGEVRARWPEHEPLPTEPWLEWGESGAREARREQAEQDLERAYDLAMRMGHRVVEIRAASLLARLVARDEARFDVAERWSRWASNLAERPGVDRLLVAEALSARGQVLLMWRWGAAHERRREEVPALYRRAIALYEDALGPLHPVVGETYESAGDVFLRGKDPERAQEQYEQALVIYEASLGSSHPAVATVLWKLGNALVQQQQAEVALEVYARALEIQHATFGEWHPVNARTWSGVGIALHLKGRLEDAQALHELALDMMDSTSGLENEVAIGILSELGFVLRDLGRLEDALPFYEDTLVLREVVAPDSIPSVLRNIGHELLENGWPDLAEEYYQRTFARQATRLPAGSTADTSIFLAEATLAQGKHANAVWHVEQAFSTIIRSSEIPGQLLPRGYFVLARALWADPRRRDEARYLAKKAREGFWNLSKPKERAFAQVDIWLEAPARRWR